MTDPASPEGQLVSYRVGELEKGVLRLGVHVDDRADRIDSRLDRIEIQLTGLTIIGQMEKRLDARVDQVEKSVADNWRLTWALLVILITAILSVLTGLVRAFG